MNRVGARWIAVKWLSAMILASLLATSALPAGAKHKAKPVAPKVVVADSSLKVKVTPQIISVEELQQIRTDSYLQAPVFPPLGHQTRDEADRLRLLNTKKQGTLTIAPYPSPVLDGGELAFRGTRPRDTTYQLDGKPVVPALTRPDTSDRDFPAGVKRNGPPPVTPIEAVQAGISGAVVVRAYIDGEGKVTAAVVLSSPSPLLDEPALQSVRMSRFTPVMWDQKTVPCAGRVAVWFKPLPKSH